MAEYISISTTMDDVIIEEHLFTNIWLYTMMGSGLIGIVLTGIMSIHSIYNLYHSKLTDKFSRIIYCVFFLSYFQACIAYAFFRTDMLLPMGTSIPCTFGFLYGTQCVFLGKLTLFIIFILRIDLAFHSSALGYPRPFLAAVMGMYCIIICAQDAAFIYDAIGLISLYPSSRTIINVCTTGNSSKIYVYIVGSMSTGDILFSIFVCSLFVYKLDKVKYQRICV